MDTVKLNKLKDETGVVMVEFHATRIRNLRIGSALSQFPPLLYMTKVKKHGAT